MRKTRLKYIKPEIEVFDLEMFDVMNDSDIVSGSVNADEDAGYGGGDLGGESKQGDFIFDTGEDFDTPPYYLYE